MRFAKHPAAWAALLPPLIIVLLVAWYQRPSARQARLDRRLVAALHAHDADAALTALRQGADPNARDYYETPPTLWVRIIHPAAASADDEDRAHHWQPVLFTAILANDARPAMTPDQVQGNNRVVQALLDRGADVNERDYKGNCALFVATTARRQDWVTLLLNRGADNGCKAQGMLSATVIGNAPIALLLIDRGTDVNARDSDSWTLLISASIFQNEAVARMLLDHGAEVNARDKRGWTALGYALTSRHPDPQIIRLLKTHGAQR